MTVILHSYGMTESGMVEAEGGAEGAAEEAVAAEDAGNGLEIL